MWNIQTVAYAEAMGLGDILDVNFQVPLPGTPAEVKYKWQMRQLYPIFLSKIKTSHCHSILTKHADARDARQIYLDLAAHYNTSVAAEFTSDDLLEFLTSAKYGKITFNGGTQEFILHWLKQLDQWDSLCNPNETMPDSHQKRLLKNAVSCVPELSNVTNTEKVLIAADPKRTKISFDEYKQLLMAAAMNYDHTLTSHPRSSRRSIKTHAFSSQYEQDDFDIDDVDVPEFTLNSSIYEINAAR
jgi:hypothetical protein